MSTSHPQVSLQSQPALFTRNFGLVSLASLTFFSSLHMLTPAFPLYLQSPGLVIPAWAVGLILSSLIGASMVFRPLIGKWCDEGSCRPFMVWGALLCVAVCLVYPVALLPWMIVMLRVFHGIGLALFYTASNAFLAQEIPLARRAEGMSHYSNAIKMAMAFAPALGLFFATRHQFGPLFGGASVAALLTFLCVLGVREKPRIVKPSAPRGKLINLHALLPGGVMATNSIVFGTLIPFVPFFFQEKGFLHEAAWFYSVYAFFLIFSRAFTGPISDRLGRAKVVIPGMLGVTLSLIFMALSANLWMFVVATALYGLCAGTVQPSLMALCADRAPADERGSAMATFTLLNDLGIVTGTLLTGTLGPLIGYSHSLWIIVAMASLGLLYFALQQSTVSPAPLNRETNPC